MTRRHLLAGLALIGAGQRLKITKLTARKHSIGNRDYLFLEIETDGGVTGLGEGSVSGRVDIVEQAIQFYTPYRVPAASKSTGTAIISNSPVTIMAPS